VSVSVGEELLVVGWQLAVGKGSEAFIEGPYLSLGLSATHVAEFMVS
jgi:hypothetical protein